MGKSSGRVNNRFSEARIAEFSYISLCSVVQNDSIFFAAETETHLTP